MKLKKLAFTLAEVMIVVTVIGIISAILLPAARNAAPDKNITKFKKTNNLFGNVIRELAYEEKYYYEGDLGMMPDGSLVTNQKYLCQTLADILNTKSVNCYEQNTSHPGAVDLALGGTLTGASILDTSVKEVTTQSTEDAREEMDKACKEFLGGTSNAHTEGGPALPGSQVQIVTTDGVSWYEVNPAGHFGILHGTNPATLHRRFSAPAGPISFPDKHGKDRVYKIFCIDIDEPKAGEDPFGYGVRADGKILYGARAQEWMKKKIQRGDN